MVTTAKALSPAFLINTGDNFYWCGIQNTSDFQVKTDWVDPYNDEALDIPWYSILGNHEYGYNVDAQVFRHHLSIFWVSPTICMIVQNLSCFCKNVKQNWTFVTLLLTSCSICSRFLIIYRKKLYELWEATI
jgi:Calcineurin-like phosphoesterase